MGFGDALKGAFRRKDSNNTTSSGSIKSTKSDRTSSFPRSSPFSSSTGVNAATVPPPSYDEVMNPTTGPGIAAHRAASPTPSSGSRLTAAAITTRDDPYAFLSTFDTIFLIDDSGSMAGSSWNQVATALEKITPICTAHDADGVDVYFINAKNPDRDSDGGWHNIKSSKQVTKLFRDVRPGGGTPLGTRLNKILRPYMAKYEAAARRCGDPEETDVKPINIIVITDGVPTDDPESAIITHAKKLDKLEAPPYQVGVQFFQVGQEPGAEEFLRDLDDNLGRAANDSSLRDIVDTVTWNGRNGRSQSLSADSILKVVLGAVVRRLDRRRTSGDVARPRHLAP